jgi:hypothetical protein
MIVIVGAGASFAEGQSASLPLGDTPPLLKDFVKTLWLQPEQLHPGPAATAFLDHLGIPYTRTNQIELLAASEGDPEMNIERLFAHAYARRNDPHPMQLPGMISPYENLLFHGLTWPLANLLRRGLLSGGEASALPLHRLLSHALRPGDIVLNLNYDTILEIALRGAEVPFSYAPHQANGMVSIAKPHGSLNLYSSEEGFVFSEHLLPDDLQPANGMTNFAGIVPPRFGKQIAQHPVAEVIFAAIEGRRSDEIVFWGTSIPRSDQDLVDTYRGWSETAKTVAFVNPSIPDWENAREILGRDLFRYDSIEAWSQR